MGSFRINAIADFVRQMSFSSHETRLAQLLSAEHLIHTLEPQKAYPFNYVIFKITGYHPRQINDELLTGMALQHDLGLLIECVSNDMNIRTEQIAEPVLTIEDVTMRFNVTGKTIHRWRRRGLAARRFVFADGKRRVGFLLSSVERFAKVRQGDDTVPEAVDQNAEAEKTAQIIRMARRIIGNKNSGVDEMTCRVGRRLNCSPLTVLHLLRKHDAQLPLQNSSNPTIPILSNASPELSAKDRLRIVKYYRRGVALLRLARKFGQPRSSIYRVILNERIRKFGSKKIKFIDDPLYHDANAPIAIDEMVAGSAVSLQKTTVEESRIPRDLPRFLADLYRTPLLSSARERALFLALNYHKFLFAQARKRLDPQLASNSDLQILEQHLQNAQLTRNQILVANLRLVVSVARKHLRPGLSLTELMSEGNITLMRAVEAFDVHRGYKFSTYATLALMKGFARSVPLMLSSQSQSGSRVNDDSRTPDIADSRSGQGAQDIAVRDEVRNLLSKLNDAECQVVTAYYGLNVDDRNRLNLSERPMVSAITYEEVGKLLGISKSRVRQIEHAAMNKLRKRFATDHREDLSADLADIATEP